MEDPGESRPSNIPITRNSSINTSVALASNALLDGDLVTLTGCGNAISKTITVAEILKRNNPGLKQENRLVKEMIFERAETQRRHVGSSLAPKMDEQTTVQDGSDNLDDADGDDNGAGEWKEKSIEKFLPKLEITLIREASEDISGNLKGDIGIVGVTS